MTATMLDVGELRRDKGTGSAPRLRADGRWETRYVGADGRRHAIYVRDRCPRPHAAKPCADARTAARLRDEAIRATEAGLNPSLQPLGEYLARYLKRRAINLTPASLARYERLVRIHVVPTEWARIPIARLRPDDVEDLYADRRAAGMAPKGIELLHTLIHGALGVAADRGHIIRNPADHVARPAIPRSVVTPYTGEQLRQLMDAADDHRLVGFVAVLCTTGLRLGELLELTWSDVDIDGRDRIVIADPEKGGVPRSVKLAPRAVRAMRAHRARQNAERLRAGGAYEETGLVFPNAIGEPSDPSWIREQLQAIAEAAKLPAVNPRGIRHAVATKLIEDGVPMKIVQELLGHRTFKQTSDTYAHVTPAMQDQVVAAITKAVGE